MLLNVVSRTRSFVVLILFILPFKILAQGFATDKIPKVDKLLKENKFVEAERLIDSILVQNPAKGITYYRKAEVLERKKDPINACQFYLKSAQRGYRMSLSYFNIARLEEIKKAPEDTIISYLEQSIHYDAGILEEIENEPALHKLLLKSLMSPKSLVTFSDSLEMDLHYAYKLLKLTHYNPYTRFSPQKIDESFQQTITTIHQVTPQKAIAQIMKFVAMMGDGHTVLVPPVNGPYRFHRYPVKGYLFADGFYVTATTEKNKEILGKKITRFNKIPAEQVVKKLSGFISYDNEMQLKWLLPYAMFIPELLEAAEINLVENDLVLSYDDNGHNVEYELSESAKITGDQLEKFIYEDETEKEWLNAKSKIEKSLETFYKVVLLTEKCIYIPFNQVKHDEQYPFTSFIDSVNVLIRQRKSPQLIIDLRNNEGGDNTMLIPFIQMLISRQHEDKTMRIICLTGRRTFSAAITLLGQLKKYGNVVIMGEPTGGKPNFIGEFNPFRLPYSGLWINSSKWYHQNTNTFDFRPWIDPDIFYEPTYKEWLLENDQLLVKALTYLNINSSY
jgi:hypothetical protein